MRKCDKDHAKELNKIVNDFKLETGSSKINIVAHSKGGLDAEYIWQIIFPTQTLQIL